MYKHHHNLVQMGYEALVHKVYRSCGGIGQAERHHYEFIMTIFGSKCEFQDVVRVMSRLRVSKPQVKGEEICSLKLVK